MFETCSVWEQKNKKNGYNSWMVNLQPLFPSHHFSSVMWQTPAFSYICVQSVLSTGTRWCFQGSSDNCVTLLFKKISCITTLNAAHNVKFKFSIMTYQGPLLDLASSYLFRLTTHHIHNASEIQNYIPLSKYTMLLMALCLFSLTAMFPSSCPTGGHPSFKPYLEISTSLKPPLSRTLAKLYYRWSSKYSPP